LARGAVDRIILRDALEKLLNMPALYDFRNMTEQQLKEAIEFGYAPEIQEDAEAILAARRALK
jgi:hypothetical protein